MIANSWRGVYSAITTKLAGNQDVDLDAVARDTLFQVESRRSRHRLLWLARRGLDADRRRKDRDREDGQAGGGRPRPGHADHRRGFDPGGGQPRRTRRGTRPRRTDGAAGDALRGDAARDHRPFPHHGEGLRPRHHGLQQPGRLSDRHFAGDVRRDWPTSRASSRSRNPRATSAASPTSSTPSAIATRSSPASTTWRWKA